MHETNTELVSQPGAAGVSEAGVGVQITPLGGGAVRGGRPGTEGNGLADLHINSASSSQGARIGGIREDVGTGMLPSHAGLGHIVSQPYGISSHRTGQNGMVNQGDNPLVPNNNSVLSLPSSGSGASTVLKQGSLSEHLGGETIPVNKTGDCIKDALGLCVSEKVLLPRCASSYKRGIGSIIQDCEEGFIINNNNNNNNNDDTNINNNNNNKNNNEENVNKNINNISNNSIDNSSNNNINKNINNISNNSIDNSSNNNNKDLHILSRSLKG